MRMAAAPEVRGSIRTGDWLMLVGGSEQEASDVRQAKQHVEQANEGVEHLGFTPFLVRAFWDPPWQGGWWMVFLGRERPRSYVSRNGEAVNSDTSEDAMNNRVAQAIRFLCCKIAT